MIPSKRMKLSDMAIQWCHENNASAAPFNIISALDSIGALKDDFEFPESSKSEKKLVKGD